MNEIKILELFGGIGALTKVFKILRIPHRVVDYVEIDKYAVASYNAMNGTNFEPQDICEWDKNIEVDLIMHGSPCQDFSIAGKQAGGDEDSGTRSSLMYETIRIVEKLKPKYVIWENVKNLLSKKHRHNFDAYLETMEQLGYTNYYQVLNAKDYGIPQNRERVFVVSILGKGTFEFPVKQVLKPTLKSYLKSIPYTDVKEEFREYSNFIIFNRGTDNQLINGSYNRVWKINHYIGTIPARHNLMKVGEITDNKLYFRLIDSDEAFKLMGFDDKDYEAAVSVNAPSIVYRQAGNSIVVPVLEAIITNLLLNNEQIESKAS